MKTHHVAFYGTLRQAVYNPAAPALGGLAEFVAPCSLWGRLLDHGPYPGFVPTGASSGGAVTADLVRILDPRFFEVFDAWEDFDVGSPEGSLYLRQRLRLARPAIDAWVYVTNHRKDDPAIAHGDWARHVRARGG